MHNNLGKHFIKISINIYDEWISNQKVEYYWLGYFLFCGVEYYGTQGNNDDDKVFYHGLSTKMSFDSFCTHLTHQHQLLYHYV